MRLLLRPLRVDVLLIGIKLLLHHALLLLHHALVSNDVLLNYINSVLSLIGPFRSRLHPNHFLVLGYHGVG